MDVVAVVTLGRPKEGAWCARVCGKRSENSSDEDLSEACLSVATAETTEWKIK